MTRTGDREIRSVSGRIPDNPGELTRMHLCKPKHHLSQHFLVCIILFQSWQIKQVL